MREGRRRARELELERRRLRQLVDNLPVGAVVVGRDGQGLAANAELERLLLGTQASRGPTTDDDELIAVLLHRWGMDAAFVEEHVAVEAGHRRPSDGAHLRLIVSARPIRFASSGLPFNP